MISDAVEMALKENANLTVVAKIADASLALTFCEKLNIDLVLMDICTDNDASGIVACQKIKEQRPHVKVVLMTGVPEITFVERAKQAGADGFVYKNTQLQNVVFTVQNTLAGYTTYPQYNETPLTRSTIALTEHEINIIKLFCDGSSRSEIAHVLYVSESTLKKQISQMLTKTGFKTMAKLVAYALANDYIKPQI